ncbi:MAG: MBL fold metallo-hydrolase [Bacilli bacterium]|nr:MBL fold metallo-hydrolase [Bacilli bacterium]MDD3304978.1 MBL fold metallo-hydrolase [Bacilli bacterium]MDD4053858.1 MBL fold metallo-hydrolase [Bacilli bacterium]MDD4411052.1 MBL fold metallo-hydrolase [Bacilli bacterium]
MKVVVLASGSKGNVTYVEEKGTRILIDIGKSCAYVEKKLKELNINPNTINAILITHTHIDHIVGIGTFYKKYKPEIYIMPKMFPALSEYLSDFNCTYFTKITQINDIRVNVIKTSHDVPDSVGFLMNDELVYITDTGYLNDRYLPMLENKSMYIMESNHDIEMLYNGKYPYHLKRRIASDIGHLSNTDSSNYLSKIVGSNTKHIVLAHLSKENNTRDKALETLFNAIERTENLDVVVAEQDERTKVIEI